MSSRDEIDRLLARGRLGAPERERILEDVLKSLRSQSPRRSKLFLLGTPFALAAGVILFMRSAGAPGGGFAPKGEQTGRSQIDCTGGPMSACPQGSKLVLHIDASRGATFVQAYADPADGSHERVWYFPTASVAPPRVEQSSEPRILEKGIVVGPEHAVGSYRVHLLLSSAPLSRQQVLDAKASDPTRIEVFDLAVTSP